VHKASSPNGSTSRTCAAVHGDAAETADTAAAFAAEGADLAIVYLPVPYTPRVQEPLANEWPTCAERNRRTQIASYNVGALASSAVSAHAADGARRYWHVCAFTAVVEP